MTEVWRERYELLEVVAQGGQARLIRGRDVLHDRPVALKVRRVGPGQSREAVLGEARVLLGLRPHPRLPVVREDFLWGEDYVVVMDWVDGPSLDRVVAERGAPGMPTATVIGWMADLAEALVHLHGHRPPIVHGDVKPANAILTASGVVLVDFGLAGSGLTQPAGTDGYIAPEVLAGERPGPAADVYALAATGLAALTGRAPIDARPPWSGLDPVAVGVIEKGLRPGLALDPLRRPASAIELVERARGWATSGSGPVAVTTAAPAPSGRRRLRSPHRGRWAVPALGLAAALTLAVGLGRVVTTKSPPPVRRLQGTDRYATAAAVAEATFPRSAVAILARGDRVIDAAASSYLAGSQGGGPILLSRASSVPAPTLDALRRLRVQEVFIMGDQSVVSATVDGQLQTAGFHTVRIAGPTRFDTAAVADQAGGAPGSLPHSGPSGVLVNADDPADALAAGPLCYRQRLPIFFTSSDQIPPDTSAAIQEDGIRHLVLVGDSSHIGPAVAGQLSSLHLTYQRIADASIASTSLDLDHFESSVLHWPDRNVVLARADVLGDVPAAVAESGKQGDPLVLADSPTHLAAPDISFLQGRRGRTVGLTVVGDPTAVSDQVMRLAARAMGLPTSG